jgi:hypothetical protein
VARAASGADEGHGGGGAADPERCAGAKHPHSAQGRGKETHGC